MKKRKKTCYFTWFTMLAFFVTLALPTNTVYAAMPSNTLDEVEMWVKIVCHDKWDKTATFHNSDDEAKPDGRLDEQDEFAVTIEGTCKLRKAGYNDPQAPFPLTLDYEEVERNFKISGYGGGQRYNNWYQQYTKWPPGGDRIEKYFLQEQTENWTYKVLGPQYDKEIISGLTISLDNENALPHYEFNIDLSYWNTGENFEGSGTQNATYRDFDGARQESSALQWPYNQAANGTSFQNWTWSEGGGIAKGDLAYDGSKYADSGEITYNYKGSDGFSTGSVQISYKINRKPGVKEIQPNQALGRYEYNNDDDYIPATDFVAGKDTVIQVFLPPDVKAEEQSSAQLKISCNGANVATLTDYKKDTKNNALIFIPPSRASCGNWQAGTYKFVATVGDSEELTLDNVLFKEQRKLKVLAVPVKANYGGTIKTAGNQWKNGAAFMRRVYPIAYNSFTYKQGSLFNASAPRYDITTDAGQHKLWLALNKLQKNGGPYDLIVGFIETGIFLPPDRVLQGYTYGPPSNIVVNSDQDMQATVAHEIAHIYAVGDEYQGGSYHLGINSPPLGYQGSDWDNPSTTVTASDPKAKPFPGAEGSLISEKLHPYDTGGRGLLEDSISFMGSGAAQSKNWISPSIWKQLYNSLTAPTTAASFTPNRGYLSATGGTRVIEVSGWVSRTGDVELSLPWTSYTTTQPIASQTGTYTIRAVDKAGNILASQGFSPSFRARSNPPREIDQAPFYDLAVPFPEGTEKFQVIDQNNAVIKELTVTSGLPTIELTSSPAAGQQLTGAAAINWTAADPDDESLYYTVEYTPDGSNWTLLAFGLSDSQWVQDFNELPGGDQAQIRVTASDGINSTIVTSNIFRVPLKAPEVFIEDPVANSSYSAAEGVVLRGSANDPQEGQILDDNRLVWTSDRLGELGRGPTVFTKKLAEGKHVISLTATSNTGQSSTQSISLNISASPTLPDTYIELPAQTFTDHAKRKVIFNQPVNAATLTGQIRVLDANNTEVPITVAAGDDGISALIYPQAGTFLPGQTYVIYVDSGIQSSSGQPLKSGYKMSFQII